MVAVAAFVLALVPASAALALAPGGSSVVPVEGSPGSDATISAGLSTLDGTQPTDGEPRSKKAMPKADEGQPSAGVGSGGEGALGRRGSGGAGVGGEDAPGRGGSGDASAQPSTTTTTIPSTTTVPNETSDLGEDSVPADRSGPSTDTTNGRPAFDPVLPPVDATPTTTTTTTTTRTTTTLPQTKSTADEQEGASGVTAPPDSPSSGDGGVVGAETAPSGTPGIDRAWKFLTEDERAPATSSSPQTIESIDPVESTSSVVLSWLVDRESVSPSMVMLSPVVVLLTVLDAAASAGSGLAAPASGLGTFVLLVLFDKGDLMNARLFRRRAEA